MVKSISVNEKLHLVMPVFADEGDSVVAYVHSAPVSREVIEAHFMLFARTFSLIYQKGLSIVGGTGSAHMLLRMVAKDEDDEDGYVALMNEMRRLTNVMMRQPTGWEALPFQDVVDHKMLNEDDLSEVTNAIVFFTVLYAQHRRRDRKVHLDGGLKLWTAQISSLDFTAYSASLTTSTEKKPITVTQEPVAESSQVF